MQVVVGHRVVPVFYGPEVHRVATLLADHVLGIVEPPQLSVALGKPGAGYAQDGGLCVVESRHIGEGGCCLFKLAFLELRLAHQQPGSPQEGIILAAVQPFDVFLCLAAALVPYGACLDAVLLDGLGRLLDGAVEVGFAQIAALLVAYGVQGYQLGAVVAVALLLLQTALDESLRTVEVGVVAGIEGMPPARFGCVVLRRARGRQQQPAHQQHDKALARMAFLSPLSSFLFPLFSLLFPLFQLCQLAVGSAAARGAVAVVFAGSHGLIVATRQDSGNHTQHYECYDYNQQKTHLYFLNMRSLRQ